MIDFEKWIDRLAIISIAALAVAFSFAVNTEWSWSFFGNTKLTDWIQSVGSLLTAWIAWRVFRLWRPQELARAKALQAPNILADLDVMLERIKSVRRGGGSFGMPPTEKDLQKVMSNWKRTAAEDCGETAKAARRKLAEIIDYEVEADMRLLVDAGTQIASAFAYIEVVSNEWKHGVIDEEGEELDIIAEELVTLGMRRRHSQLDEFGREIDRIAASLRQRLRSHLIFEG